MGFLGLGASFDVGSGVVPIDFGAGATTGHRVHLQNYGAVAFFGFINNGTAAENPTFTLQEHDTATGGVSQNLVVVDEFWQKEELALDGDEVWARVAQTAAATVTDVTWDDANEVLFGFKVEAEELTDGFEWLSVNVDDPGVAHVGCVFYVMYDLKIQRAPQNLIQPNV